VRSPAAWVLFAASWLSAGFVHAQAQTQALAVSPSSQAVAAEAKSGERSISEWLARMHEASRKRAYAGTFVVSSASSMSSARIWHVCDGDRQMDRVESLTGVPRSTFRRNGDVITFYPETKTAWSEKRDDLGLFPNLLKATDSSIEQYYAARHLGVERVAGLEADVVQLQAKDTLRYGYRVWSERKTGLVVKLQTLDVDGKVLEQAAYSELQLDAPVNMGKLAQMMANIEGYKVEKPELVKTTALAEGWALKSVVAGFKPMSCYRRTLTKGDGRAGDGVPAENTLQWIFSDGLASVSLFAEVFDRHRHVQEGLTVLGATKSLTRRLADGQTQWWLTAVGEVPTVTLTHFSQGLERKK
jgi:sigma-E factor negative regulatory protein RseB